MVALEVSCIDRTKGRFLQPGLEDAMSDIRLVVSCRNRAEALRDMAEDFHDESKETLLRMAYAYEEMANSMERRVLRTPIPT